MRLNFKIIYGLPVGNLRQLTEAKNGFCTKLDDSIDSSVGIDFIELCLLILFWNSFDRFGVSSLFCVICAFEFVLKSKTHIKSLLTFKQAIYNKK